MQKVTMDPATKPQAYTGNFVPKYIKRHIASRKTYLKLKQNCIETAETNCKSNSRVENFE